MISVRSRLRPAARVVGIGRSRSTVATPPLLPGHRLSAAAAASGALELGQRHHQQHQQQHRRRLWTSRFHNGSFVGAPTDDRNRQRKDLSQQGDNMRTRSFVSLTRGPNGTFYERILQDPFLPFQVRSFSTTTTTTASTRSSQSASQNDSSDTPRQSSAMRSDDLPKDDNDAVDDATWRDRLNARRENIREEMSEHGARGRAAAKRGAKSFREMVRQYGPVFVWTYGGVYLGTLAGFFVAINSGLVDPAYVISYVSPSVEGESAKTSVQVVVEVMDHYAWTRPWVPFFERNPGLANFGVAWIAVKFTEPIRFGLTVAVVPRLARYFGYVGANDAKEVKPTTSSTTSLREEELSSPDAVASASDKSKSSA